MPDWISATDPRAVPEAVAVIEAGGLVVLPTDTVYGVAADMWRPYAVEAIYRAKQRPPERAIPILLADPANIESVAQSVPDAAYRLAEAFWPGPLTIVVPRRPEVPEIVSALPTIGLRIPDHPTTREVIRACGGALAVSSANLSDAPPALTAREAALALGDGVALVLDGGTCPGGTPSTVVDVTGGEIVILRRGPISEVSIRQVLAEA